jgi:membrane associated rhomboid family serine protease/Tfp pilus assembly protein PilF
MQEEKSLFWGLARIFFGRLGRIQRMMRLSNNPFQQNQDRLQMRPPPPLQDFWKYPITVGVGTLAAVATFAWHSGKDIAPLVMDIRAWHGQPWRLVTSALPHVNVFHLLFNLYWLWVFGSAIETVYGGLRTLAIFLFFAAGSMAAEYAIFDGGVGLSGVGYGLFGLLWVLSPRDARFHNAIDGQTVRLFVVWFFLCIFLSVTGIMPVANVAHGVGALQGILLGCSLTAERGNHIVIAGLAALVLLIFGAATVGRPFVNLSAQAEQDMAYLGYLDLEEGRNEDAVAMYERAVKFNDRQADWWFNLGIAYQRLGNESKAIRAYRMAGKLDPDSATYRKTAANWLGVLAYRKLAAGQDEEAVGLFREALDLDGGTAANWFNMGIALERVGRHDAAILSYEKALSLSPANPHFQQVVEDAKKRAK